MSDRLLVDTRVVIWILEASPRISSRAKRALFDPATTLLVSVVSIWEMIFKYQARKLILTTSLDGALDRIIHQSPWALLPVIPEHLSTLATLPTVHKDPFDRMLVAQAGYEGLIILTPDKDIAKYDVRTLW